jgi:hypothetical protein
MYRVVFNFIDTNHHTEEWHFQLPGKEMVENLRPAKEKLSLGTGNGLLARSRNQEVVWRMKLHNATFSESSQFSRRKIMPIRSPYRTQPIRRQQSQRLLWKAIQLEAPGHGFRAAVTP